jgi:hypothetical protein
MPVIPALRRQRQEDSEFQPSLGHIAKLERERERERERVTINFPQSLAWFQPTLQHPLKNNL